MSSKGPMGGSDPAPPVGPQYNDPNFRIYQISVNSGLYVDALQLHYVDKNSGSTFVGTKYGGGGGAPSNLKFGSGNLTAIDIYAGRWIDKLTFRTDTGEQYTVGGSGGSYVGTLAVDSSNQAIYDLAVGYGDYLNNLTIYY